MPAVQLAADHDGQADAAVQPDQHEVVDALGRPAVPLGDRGQVDVVLEDDRPVEVGAERGEQAPVPPRQVPGERDLAALRVDQAGRAEYDPANPLQGGAGRLGRLDDGGVHDLDRVVALADRHVGAPDDVAGDVGRGRDHVLGTGLDPDDERGGRHDRVHLGVGPAPAGLLADAGDQAALLQPLDQLGGGDLGQPGELAELGPGQRAAVEQQLEGGAVVERPQETRGSGLSGWTHDDL